MENCYLKTLNLKKDNLFGLVRDTEIMEINSK